MNIRLTGNLPNYKESILKLLTFQKDEDTIWIEYGSYNPKIYKEPLKDHIFMQIPIDGTEALFETSRNNYGGFASVYIPITDSAQGFYT